jgi:hypothetical protein
MGSRRRLGVVLGVCGGPGATPREGGLQAMGWWGWVCGQLQRRLWVRAKVVGLRGSLKLVWG